MKQFIRMGAASIALAFASQLRAAELTLPKDGWVSWQVEAVDDAPAFCCWNNWGDEPAPAKPCNLDGEQQGFGSRDKQTTDSVRVYARMANGKVERLRTLAAVCAVETNTPIQKLDNVAADDSARWLIGLARRNDLDQEVLISLGMHRGNVAFDALRSLALDDSRDETRKHAIFWLALTRGVQGADVVTSTMFNDANADVRRHAAFAITQSKSPTIPENLIKLGNTDQDGEVRAQAWFWLAHTGAANAEQPIIAAAKNDASDHVREQAVFALSQLPGDRSVRALIAMAQDRSLSHAQRKRAVFWLAQSKSPDALAYLDQVLVQSAAK